MYIEESINGKEDLKNEALKTLLEKFSFSYVLIVTFFINNVLLIKNKLSHLQKYFSILPTLNPISTSPPKKKITSIPGEYNLRGRTRNFDKTKGGKIGNSHAIKLEKIRFFPSQNRKKKHLLN